MKQNYFMRYTYDFMLLNESHQLRYKRKFYVNVNSLDSGIKLSLTLNTVSVWRDWLRSLKATCIYLQPNFVRYVWVDQHFVTGYKTYITQQCALLIVYANSKTTFVFIMVTTSCEQKGNCPKPPSNILMTVPRRRFCCGSDLFVSIFIVLLIA